MPISKDRGSIIVAQEELDRQMEFCGLVHTVLETRLGGRKPLAYVHTFGCQGNVADSERLKGLLEKMGFGFTDEAESADISLFNTCAVREHAEDRLFGNVGALKKIKEKNPDFKIILCGCMMQQERIAEKIRRSYPFVDIVFGTHAAHKFPELLYRSLSTGKRVFDIENSDGVIAEDLPLHRDSTFKAWLPIMYGCNNFCTYCIVPYVRGRERSRSSDVIISEARELVKSGYKEITLLGQNVNSYGNDREGELNFAALLREINSIDGDFIIRFMTSHPKDRTHELLDTMAQCEKVAKHLHLPVQCGNDRVLKEMNRGYTAEKYLSLLEYARSVMPELSVTSDIIVGFPGETYEEFLDTVKLIEKAQYTSLYTFIFSPREGTRAAKMDDPVSREEKGKWFSELCAAQEKIASVRTSEMVGREYRVLCESKAKKDGYISGRTQGNIIIEFPADESVIGSFRTVRVTEALIWMLKGELAD